MMPALFRFDSKAFRQFLIDLFRHGVHGAAFGCRHPASTPQTAADHYLKAARASGTPIAGAPDFDRFSLKNLLTPLF